MTEATTGEHVALQVVAVIVTYNRRELLLESLSALQAQSRPPDAIVVVDNASDDGTAEIVRARHHDIRLVQLSTNTGGAGGFAAGLAIALADGADMVWLMDDDTVPEPSALAELLEAFDAYPDRRPVLLASRVVWTDGRDHPMNTPRPKPLADRRERRAAAALRCVPIRSASFVSVVVDGDICRARGLPIADYFLWNDDFEFTTRILRGNIGLYCPSSRVVHKTAKFGSTDVDPGERFFYEVRNKVWMLTRSKSLGPVDRALYTASTLRRWLRMLQRSSNRGELLHALRRGLAEGLRRAPRPTAQVLAEAGAPVSIASSSSARGSTRARPSGKSRIRLHEGFKNADRTKAGRRAFMTKLRSVVSSLRRPSTQRDFEYVFVVTYGRSGSTLVQGLLNSLPNTLVRGENNFYILSLFRAQSLARSFKRKYAKGSNQASSAFFGLRQIDLDAFATSAGELTVRQLLGNLGAAGIHRIGFKEVLWHRIRPAETKAFFEFFEKAFPGAKYVLNQRDHEQVLGSGFWQRQEETEGKAALLRVEQIQAFLRETRPAQTYDLRYEVITGDDGAADTQLRGLAKFVTGSCNDALLATMRETMKRGHGPNPFGKSRGRRNRATS